MVRDDEASPINYRPSTRGKISPQCGLRCLTVAEAVDGTTFSGVIVTPFARILGALARGCSSPRQRSSGIQRGFTLVVLIRPSATANLDPTTRDLVRAEEGLPLETYFDNRGIIPRIIPRDDNIFNSGLDVTGSAWLRVMLYLITEVANPP
jgi:hypothetical protein